MSATAPGEARAVFGCALAVLGGDKLPRSFYATLSQALGSLQKTQRQRPQKSVSTVETGWQDRAAGREAHLHQPLPSSCPGGPCEDRAMNGSQEALNPDSDGKLLPVGPHPGRTACPGVRPWASALRTVTAQREAKRGGHRVPDTQWRGLYLPGVTQGQSQDRGGVSPGGIRVGPQQAWQGVGGSQAEGRRSRSGPR